MVRNASDAIGALRGIDPVALKHASESYFGSRWLVPTALVCAQAERPIFGAKVGVERLGIDRSTVLRNIDKLIEWRAVAELERESDAPRSDKRTFALIEGHFLWALMPELHRWALDGGSET